MNVIVFSSSTAFDEHIKSACGSADNHIRIEEKLDVNSISVEDVCLLHLDSYDKAQFEAVIINVLKKNVPVAVATNMPAVESMLSLTAMGVKGYCNAFMAPAYYQQLLSLVAEGASWFPPKLLSETFEIAQRSLATSVPEKDLALLTDREKEVAMNVALGKSNKVIANEFSITERTVKAHLNKVYKKLHIKDRIELALYFRS